MKIQYLLIIACLMTACKSKPSIVNTAAAETKPVETFHKATSATVKVPLNDTSETDDITNQYEDYYIVVADTGTNYYTLRDKMTDLNKSLGIAIDTMDRFYNKSKDLIALPDNYDDDIYAGEYFPRREPSQTLSLEYLDTYKPSSGKKTIALVTGIYERQFSADSALHVINKAKNAFAFKAKVYIGCMH